MSLDLLLIMIGILLAAAMILTLIYGKEYSIHGYGTHSPFTQKHPLVYPT